MDTFPESSHTQNVVRIGQNMKVNYVWDGVEWIMSPSIQEAFQAETETLQQLRGDLREMEAQAAHTAEKLTTSRTLKERMALEQQRAALGGLIESTQADLQAAELRAAELQVQGERGAALERVKLHAQEAREARDQLHAGLAALRVDMDERLAELAGVWLRQVRAWRAGLEATTAAGYDLRAAETGNQAEQEAQERLDALRGLVPDVDALLLLPAFEEVWGAERPRGLRSDELLPGRLGAELERALKSSKAGRQ